MNNYKDKDNFRALSGAVNDATDIYEKLKNNGGFEIADKHFLTDDAANAEAIRHAISDLLWESGNCEIALFYFSGHGFQDGYGDGYLVAHDMARDAPMVCGIRMQELKDRALAVVKQNVLLILDCCYSGLTIGGVEEKAVAEVFPIRSSSVFPRFRAAGGLFLPRREKTANRARRRTAYISSAIYLPIPMALSPSTCWKGWMDGVWTGTAA